MGQGILCLLSPVGIPPVCAFFDFLGDLPTFARKEPDSENERYATKCFVPVSAVSLFCSIRLAGGRQLPHPRADNRGARWVCGHAFPTGRTGVERAGKRYGAGRRFSLDMLLPEGSGLEQCLLACDSGAFSNYFAKVWVIPGVSLKVEGDGPYPRLWRVESPLPEQALENALLDNSQAFDRPLCVNQGRLTRLYPHIWPAQGEERERLSAERAVLESVRDSLELELLRCDVAFLERTSQVDTAWVCALHSLAQSVYYNQLVSSDSIRVSNLFRTRLSPARQATPIGKEIAAFLFPPKPVAEGDAMADWVLYDTEGKQHRLSDYADGKRFLLLDFWSAGCGPCIQSFPETKGLAEEHAGELVVLSISLDPKDLWLENSKLHEFGGPNLNDLKLQVGISLRYGVNGIPHYVFVSPDGKVAKIQIGYGPGVLKAVFDQVKKEYLKGKEAAALR